MNIFNQTIRYTKNLQAATPSGMNTRFWENSPRDVSAMLEPKWAAKQILMEYSGNFKYKYIRILRGPARVEVVETRQ